ncbi:alpha/beta hydrolase [Polaribacter porphyrae]|nr:alpha/beta hydrolase [Polaribacter porphyrae]
MKLKKYALLLFILTSTFSYAQEKILYKQIDSIKLYMEVHKPKNMNTSTKYPAIVFFFGGGWNGGSVYHFKPQADYFVKRGMVCFLVDYRVEKRQKTTPFESLKDAKSAIRFVRKNAQKFNIDPTKIVGAGGSAGGHLAAATALIDAYNEKQDNLEISCKPNALVLFNPVIDNGPGGYGYQRIKNEYKNFSPLHNIKKGAPPTILFLGTNDALIPVETVKYYKLVMDKVKSRCDLHLFKDQKHGFFNYRFFKYYKETLSKSDSFLQSIGFLNKNPIIEIE